MKGTITELIFECQLCEYSSVIDDLTSGWQQDTTRQSCSLPKDLLVMKWINVSSVFPHLSLPVPRVPPYFTSDRQWKVQFCIFLQVSIRLYSDHQNLKSVTTSLHSQYVIKCSMCFHEIICRMFCLLQLHFPKAAVLNLADLAKMCINTTYFNPLRLRLKWIIFKD
jgi:hypothetical protein